jgi:ubiquinone/menaquinone biosynthesis C-methylase UbiE
MPERVRAAHARNERAFDAWASKYQESAWFGGTSRSRYSYEVTRRRVVQGLSLTGEEEVLELGCGPGTWTRVIASAAGHVTALDLSEKMLDRARRFVQPFDVTFVHADALLFRSDRPYDRVVSVRAIEYVADKEALAEQLVRLTADDGVLVVVTKNPFSAWGLRRTYWQVRGFLERLRRRLGRAETEPESDEEHHYMQRIPPWRFIRLLRHAGFDQVTVSPVVVGLPIMANAPGEVPLIPKRLAPTVLQAGNRLSDWLGRLPQKVMVPLLFFSESYCVTARKHPAVAPRGAQASGTDRTQGYEHQSSD